MLIKYIIMLKLAKMYHILIMIEYKYNFIFLFNTFIILYNIINTYLLEVIK